MLSKYNGIVSSILILLQLVKTNGIFVNSNMIDQETVLSIFSLIKE